MPHVIKSVSFDFSAFVPFEMLDDFRAGIDGVLGKGACRVLSIRPQGGVEMCVGV